MKNKKPKRMMNGGRVVTGVPMNPSSRGKVRRKIGKPGSMAGRPATPVRTAGGLGMVSPAGQAQAAQNVINKMNAERATAMKGAPAGQMPSTQTGAIGALGPLPSSQNALRAMRGGGLARKGVGQALAAGGAVRACGVAQKGKTKGKMV